MVVIGLGKNLLFKSVLAHCEYSVIPEDSILSESFDFSDVVSLVSVAFPPNEKVDSGFETFDAAEPKANVEAAPELFEVSKMNKNLL